MELVRAAGLVGSTLAAAVLAAPLPGRDVLRAELGCKSPLYRDKIQISNSAANPAIASPYSVFVSVFRPYFYTKFNIYVRISQRHTAVPCNLCLATNPPCCARVAA